MSNIQTLYVGNDTILEVGSLKNELTGAFLNSAAVTVTVTDMSGVEVSGDTWPKTMAYLTGSDGVYRATLLHGLALVAGTRYQAEVAADAGTGLYASWTIDCVARDRV